MLRINRMRLAIAIYSLGFLTAYAYPHKDQASGHLAVDPSEGEMHSGVEDGKMDMIERISTGMLMSTAFLSVTVWYHNFPVKSNSLIPTLFPLFFISADDQSLCLQKYERVGCFHDEKGNRSLGQLLITRRDNDSAVFDTSIDWLNYPDTLQS